MKIHQIAGLALISAAFSAVAAPTLLVTSAPTKDGRTLVSVDFVADPAQPVGVVVAHVGIRDQFLSDKRINLGKCNIEGGKTWVGCGLGHGDVSIVVDGNGRAIETGNLGSFVVPTDALERSADGIIRIPLVEFTSPDGGTVTAKVEGDGNAAGAKTVLSGEALE